MLVYSELAAISDVCAACFIGWYIIICFCFLYSSWGSNNKYTGVVCLPFSSGSHFVRTLHYEPYVLGVLHGIIHSFIELHKPLCHDKAWIHEGKGQGNLVCCNLGDGNESDTTQRLNYILYNTCSKLWGKRISA